VTEHYRFSYRSDTVYQRALDLVSRHRLNEGKIVVDIGCGYGAIAEPLAGLGLSYFGIDVDPDSVADLRQRGFEAEVIDLSDADGFVGILTEHLGERALAAIVMIDALEHLPNGPAVMAALQRLAVAHDCCPIVVAVPNVTHIDLIGKLILGRWDVTETGLLDETHVAFFSAARLTDVMRKAGWLELATFDYEQAESDQHFPASAASVQWGSPLRELLYAVRAQASPGVDVNEFVRVYAPVGATHETEVESAPRPFLSVLMRTQIGRRATIEEALVSLAAQTCDDFEVLILPHDAPREAMPDLLYLVDVFPQNFSQRVRIIPVFGGGRARPLNVGLAAASGDYVVILDDDDVVFGHWVERFKGMAARYPGRVLRAIVADQLVEQTTWNGDKPGYDVVGPPVDARAPKFEVIDHLLDNHSPNCGWAIPRSAFTDFGISFDESLSVLEDWDLLMRVVQWAGVASIEDITSLYRHWQVGDSSTSVHSNVEWERARMSVFAKLNSRPVLLPPHSVTRFKELVEELRCQSEATAAAAAAQAQQLGNELTQARAERDHYSSLFHNTEVDRQQIHEELLDAHRRLLDTWASPSWKWARPLRSLERLIPRKAPRRD
jgi:2-polyprenyl-3-methyl-5-hydroxy-6-metoxy-1,4-benzoquinol methylase